VPDLILETRGLTKEFRGFTAVQGVDLKVRRGTIHALIGPNGAGKITVFNLLTKFLEPSAGRIYYRAMTSPPPGRPISPGAAWCARSRSRRCSRI
jgi:ABC-type branched-subunit amino acid transport system ATPase component